MAPGHFLLLAEEISVEWREAVAPYLHAYRVTNGQSLDDALAPANRRLHITLVGSADGELGVPTRWEDEIRRRAPHVVIDRLEATTAGELRRIAVARVERGDRYGARDSET